VGLLEALLDTLQAEEVSVLALSGLLEELEADTTLKLFGSVLIHNQCFNGDASFFLHAQ